MPLEFVCKCGIEPAFYKHCSKDEERIILGRITQVWEER